MEHLVQVMEQITQIDEQVKWCSIWKVFLGPDMASEGLVCSQVRHSECQQGCVPFGFGLRELWTSSCLRLVSRL